MRRVRVTGAVYLLLREYNKILLLERLNTGYQDDKYSLVAGHLDGDELSSSAIIREAYEEAGIKIQEDDLRFVHLSHRLNRDHIDNERLDIFFECDCWQGTVKNMEEDKCSDLSWFDLDNLPDNMLPFIREVLTHIQEGRTYSEYLVEPCE